MLTAATSAYSAEVTSDTQRGAQQGLLSQTQDATFALMPILLGLIAARTSNGTAIMATGVMMAASTAAFGALCGEHARR